MISKKNMDVVFEPTLGLNTDGQWKNNFLQYFRTFFETNKKKILREPSSKHSR